MKRLPKLPRRKNYSKKSIKSAVIAEKQDSCKSIGFLEKKRKLTKKPLSMPLTHVLVNKDETYDITKEYEFGELLGFGTYAQVKLAKCLETGKTFAVKICRGTNSIDMLKHERDLLSKLKQKFFPKVIDFKTDKLWNRAYLILEYFEGPTLEQYLKENCDLSSERILDFFSQLCTIIKFLHLNKICHRDIKPQNIIVTSGNKLKLIDFNISKKTLPGEAKSAVFMTQVSTTMYAAPEVLKGKGYDHKIDIWGLGVIGYLLLGATIDENQARVQDEHLIRYKEFQQYVKESTKADERLRTFIYSCLEENPSNRPCYKSEEYDDFTQSIDFCGSPLIYE